MRVIIIGSSSEKHFSNIYNYRENDFIICTDNAILDLMKLNLKADIAIGDFDSGGYLEAEANAKIINKFKIEKNETDLELALMTLEKIKNIDEVYIFNCLGGRKDHEIINIKLVYKYTLQYNFPIYIVNDTTSIRCLTPGEYTLEKENYDHLSLINIDKCELEITGTKYELKKTMINPFDTYTVSNSFMNERCFIKIYSGNIICFLVKEK